MIPFLGFLPDVEQTTSGALLEVSNIIPTTNGFRALPSLVDTGVDQIPDPVNSIAEVEKLNASKRLFVGTETRLYEISLTGYTDRSGATYNCNVDHRWSFAQFGDYTLAANLGDAIQVSTTGNFAAIAGAPNAKYIAVSDGFIMAVYTDTSPDQWHCSAYNDYADWTEAVSTQCTSGRVIGGGAFTGIKALGSGFVAFKKRNMYIASYVGAPVVWQWDEIEGDIGCESSDSAVDIGDRIAFLGHDDFYVFDGARNISIGDGVREWFFANSNPDFRYKTIATYDKVRGNVSFHYCSSNNPSGDPDKTMIYNLRTGKWGHYSVGITAAASIFQDSILYDDFSTGFGATNWDDLPTDLTYDSYLNRGSVAYVKSDGKIYTFSGTAGNSTITMNVFGDDELFTTLSQIRPRFQVAPQTSYIQYSYDNEYGDVFTEKGTYSLIDGRYDLMNSARWHKVKFYFNGDMVITGVKINLIEDGTE